MIKSGLYKYVKTVLPVNTHIQTMNKASEKESNSAAVNRPHIPKENLLPSEHGLVIYWHMGKRRKAKATVAITETRKNIIPLSFIEL